MPDVSTLALNNDIRGTMMVRRLLVPSSALLWGLQLAFLSPALALILVNLYGATTAQVGWVLAIYNASGFIASLLLPAYADKKTRLPRADARLRRAHSACWPWRSASSPPCRWRPSPSS